MKRLLLFGLVGFGTGLVISSCGSPVSPPACSPTSCDGCCDPADKCKTGTLDSSCGSGGKACNVCVAGQVCAAAVCAVPATDGGSDGGTSDAGTADAGGADGGVDGGSDAGVDAGNLCPPKAITCSDQAIVSLDLKNTVNAALITNQAEDGGFKTTIDATGGGFTPTMSFVYGKFTAAGLQKVSISDEAALASVDWDIAFRRFVVRLNAGSSGPSCVAAAVTSVGTSYDTFSGVPSGGTFAVDDFEGPPPTCTFKDDGSGLPTTPSTALANQTASFYTYASCVAMTGRVFLVRTREGRHLKLLITTYYQTEAAQLTCNGGASPGVPGGTIRVRWSWLD